MKIIIQPTYEALSEAAYEVLKQVLDTTPRPILGLATGSSPVGLYGCMIEGHKNGVSYKDVQTVNLDEYVGLPKSNDQSYDAFMKANLFDHIDILPENTHLPDGNAADIDAECARYTRLLNELQQDIQVLGIGANGHIGFNEPGTPFESTTHVVCLKEKTRLDNARFFDSLADVPTHAITMGIANIMHAKRILVVANGSGKADAVKAMIEGPITEDCPASILQKHPHVTVVLDEAAAAKLSK